MVSFSDGNSHAFGSTLGQILFQSATSRMTLSGNATVRRELRILGVSMSPLYTRRFTSTCASPTSCPGPRSAQRLIARDRRAGNYGNAVEPDNRQSTAFRGDLVRCREVSHEIS